jgi:hypothetical protein
MTTSATTAPLFPDCGSRSQDDHTLPWAGGMRKFDPRWLGLVPSGATPLRDRTRGEPGQRDAEIDEPARRLAGFDHFTLQSAPRIQCSDSVTL